MSILRSVEKQVVLMRFVLLSGGFVERHRHADIGAQPPQEVSPAHRLRISLDSRHEDAPFAGRIRNKHRACRLLELLVAGDRRDLRVLWAPVEERPVGVRRGERHAHPGL